MNETKKQNIKITIIAIIAIILMCIAITPKELQEDTYYLIKVGEYIIDNGIDQSVEPFSFHEGLPYSYPHWLFNVLLYGIDTLYNFEGIYIMTVILAIAIGLTLYFTMKKLYKNNIVASAISVITMFLLLGFMTARGQMIGFIAFALEIYNVERLLKTGNNKNILALVLISLVLANMYAASYMFFFVLLLPYIAEYIISILNKKEYLKNRTQKLKTKQEILKVKLEATKNEKYSKKIEKINNKIEKINQKIENIPEKQKNNNGKLEIEKNNNAKLLFIVVILAIIAGMCTPIGETPYMYLINTLKGNTTLFISEHQPFTPISSMPSLVAIIISVGIMIFSKAKIKLREIFMLLGLTILTCSAQRQWAVLAIVGSYIMCRLITETIKIHKPNLSEKITQKITKFPYSIYTILITAIFSIFLYSNIVAGTEYVNKTFYPVDACKWIKENLDVKNARIFNGFNYGSYLIYEEIPVFIDGRADAYDPAFYGDINENDIFTDYMLVSSLQQEYETTFEKYEITHVMLTSTESLNLLLEKDENYKKVYSDSAFNIYERNTGKDMEALEPDDPNHAQLYKDSNFAIYDTQTEQEAPTEVRQEAEEGSETVTIYYDENGNVINNN